MLPLAASGPAVLGVVIVCALLLVWVLLRVERRDETEERDEREP